MNKELRKMFHKFRYEIDEYAFPLIEDMSEVLIAEEKGRPVGFLMVCKDGYIDSLWVHPEHRRKGIGRKLVMDYIRKYGLPDRLHIVNTNRKALLFWKKVFDMCAIDKNEVDTLYWIRGLK